MVRKALPVLFLALSVSSSAYAQDMGAAPVAPVPPVPRQAVSTNPLFDVAGFWNVDYSRRLNAVTTLGVTATTVEKADIRYTPLNATIRFYPQGRALSGFFIGGKAGVHRVSSRDESGFAFGTGVDLGYDWLFGRNRNFQFGLGAGLTRLFGGDIDGAELYLPTFRANFGYAF